MNHWGAFAISEQWQLRNLWYLSSMLLFLHVHAHTHYINTGCLTQKWALKVLEAPCLLQTVHSVHPKCTRLFSLCHGDCGQHIHSLGMVELSTVKTIVCLLWIKTSVRNSQRPSKKFPQECRIMTSLLPSYFDHFSHYSFFTTVA